MEASRVFAEFVRPSGCQPVSPGPILVLATNGPGTTLALRRAAELARDSRCSVVLLVPHVTTFAVGADQSASTVADLADEFRGLASRTGVDVAVRVCVCRRIEDLFTQLVPAPSTIVLGGNRGPWFWPTAQWRLARTLIRCGYHVVFEDIAHHAASGTGATRSAPSS
jgi:hypothetical protein